MQPTPLHRLCVSIYKYTCRQMHHTLYSIDNSDVLLMLHVVMYSVYYIMCNILLYRICNTKMHIAHVHVLHTEQYVARVVLCYVINYLYIQVSVYLSISISLQNGGDETATPPHCPTRTSLGSMTRTG